MRHADPEGGVVVRRPIPLGNFNRRQVAIEQRAGADFCERVRFQLDAAVRILSRLVWIRHVIEV